MRKRLVFHFLNFIVLCIVIIISTVIYHYFSPHFKDQSLMENLSLFFSQRRNNLALIAILSYFFIYVTGIVKYTIEDKHLRTAGYLREVFKLMLILGMVSFVEFFVFFNTKIGRLIYLYVLAMYSIYYLAYLGVRYHRGPRKLLWLVPVAREKILEKYINPGDFHITEAGSGAEVAPGPDVAVVYLDGSITEDTSESLIRNKLAGNTVIELVELIEKESGKIPLAYVNVHWFLEKFDVIDRSYFRSSRMFNIMLSIILIILLFPPAVIFALVHKCFSKGPVFFIQQRTGLHEKKFNLIKFRTMVADAEKDAARFSGKDDPRITPIGKIMRRLRLDEVPQFINVLKGDMSLVGPRPERDVFIETLAKEIPYYKLRLLVPPGLTGWAQINGVYAGDNIEDHKEKLEYDLYYIKNRNIFMDLLILLRTVKTIIQAKGE